MDRTTASFVDGIGAAAATSGILTQQQGRIFALLYLQDSSLSLEEIAAELEQSKSNVSLNIRVLVAWQRCQRRDGPNRSVVQACQGRAGGGRGSHDDHRLASR